MITVWSVCVGDKYSAADVWTLKNMVAENLDAPHRFLCLSDRPLEGIECVIPAEEWPGWWSKLLVFRYSRGPCLYLDLDVVVTGPLDGLLSDTLAMAKNWAQSGYGGCQSSVMAWNNDIVKIRIADYFELSRVQEPTKAGDVENCGLYVLDDGATLWGDQEFITAHYGPPGGDMILPMEGIYSYKYHCRGKQLPADAKVIAFHGNPKPADVSDPWVQASRFM
jgi:hypothetical protein